MILQVHWIDAAVTKSCLGAHSQQQQQLLRQSTRNRFGRPTADLGPVRDQQVLGVLLPRQEFRNTLDIRGVQRRVDLRERAQVISRAIPRERAYLSTLHTAAQRALWQCLQASRGALDPDLKLASKQEAKPRRSSRVAAGRRPAVRVPALLTATPAARRSAAQMDAIAGCLAYCNDTFVCLQDSYTCLLCMLASTLQELIPIAFNMRPT